MKKIMFEHRRFCLEQAVLSGIKTMTRRAVNDKLLIDAQVYSGGDIERRDQYLLAHSPYKAGEVVAVAQSYKTLADEHPGDQYANYYINQFRYSAGWTNKMFVRSDLMPRRIRIKGVRVEHLRDISDKDCRREGIVRVGWRRYPESGCDRYEDYILWTIPMYSDNGRLNDDIPSVWAAHDARNAFHALINLMMGCKVWTDNPLVYVYEFEVAK